MKLKKQQEKALIAELRKAFDPKLVKDRLDKKRLQEIEDEIVALYKEAFTLQQEIADEQV